MKKGIMRIVTGALTVVMLAGTLMACGKKVEPAANEESNIKPPYMEAMNRYDSVISQLKPGQAYAFADMCSSYDALLVADGVYDDLNGNKVTIEAKVYGIGPDGKVQEFTTVSSGGTAYPLATYDGCLMVVNNYRAMMEFIDPEVCSVITKKCVEVSYDTNGKATYSYMDYDTKKEGTTENDSMMQEMYNMYGKAVAINFTEVK